MFSDNIIPDDMLDDFYDKKKETDLSNNIIDLSNNPVNPINNPVDPSNNQVQINNIPNNRNHGGGGGVRGIRYIIRPIDKDGNMKKFWNDY